MATDDAQHFDLPFRFDSRSGHVATVVQDTVDDIANCVELTLIVEPGVRLEVPQFGTLSQVFEKQPLNLEDILNHVYKYEPRASVAMSQEVGADGDALIDRIEAVVSRIHG